MNDLLVYSPLDATISRMFANRGYRITDQIKEADIVCFPGGSDIHWTHYANSRNSKVSYFFNEIEDEKELELWHKCSPEQFKFGICKGFQWLNIWNGGSLIPEIGDHSKICLHKIKTLYGEEIHVNSSHHQAIVPSRGCSVLARHEGIVEAAMWPVSRSFGVQFHPEWTSCPKQGIDWTFEQINKVFQKE